MLPKICPIFAVFKTVKFLVNVLLTILLPLFVIYVFNLSVYVLLGSKSIVSGTINTSTRFESNGSLPTSSSPTYADGGIWNGKSFVHTSLLPSLIVKSNPT